MKHSQIKLGAIISYIAIFFNIGAGLIYTPWMIRQIGVSDYGLYSLMGAFLSYFLIDFGLGSTIARFIAKFRAEGNESKIKIMLGVTSRIYLLLDLIILFVLTLIFFFLSNIFVELTATEIEKLKVIYLIAGFFSLFSFPLTPVSGAMIAYERFIVLKFSDLLQKILTITFMVIAIFLGHGLFALVFINGIVGFGIKLFNFFYIKRKEQLNIDFKHFDLTMAKELFSFSSWIFIIGIAQRLLLNIVPSILGILSGSKQIAIFSIALTLENFIFSFANALNGLFLPKVTRMSVNNSNRGQISNLMIRVGRIQLFILGLIIIGIIVFGKSFLKLWIGEEFIQSYYVLLFLVVPSIIHLTQQIANDLLYAVNEVKYRAFLFIIASVLSVIIGAVLAPSLGAIGTAIGVGIALVLCHEVGMNIVYSKVLKLDIRKFFKSVHLKMFLPFLISGGISTIGQIFIKIDNWYSFIFSTGIFVIIYVFLLWKFVLNDDEKFVILSTMRN